MRRAKRVWPARDEKILASWNGLMIRALAEAARAFRRADVGELAIRAGTFAFTTLVRGGRALRSAKDADARIPGFLEDYAALGLAALSLYELTFDRAWLTRASSMGDTARELFWDAATEAFFDTAIDHETLVIRPRDVAEQRHSFRCSSLVTDLLIRLGTLFDDTDAMRLASRMIETVAEPMARYPLAFGNMLCAADMMVSGTVELVLVGASFPHSLDDLAAVVGDHYLPGLVMASGDGTSDGGVGLLRDRPPIDGAPTAYVCRGFACDLPTTDPVTLRRQLSEAVTRES